MMSLMIQGATNAYKIDVHPNGVVSCSCPSWVYSKKPTQARVCKHVKQLAELLNSKIAQSV